MAARMETQMMNNPKLLNSSTLSTNLTTKASFIENDSKNTGCCNWFMDCIGLSSKPEK